MQKLYYVSLTRFRSKILFIIGIAKAPVLPDPVHALAKISLPSKANGIARS